MLGVFKIRGKAFPLSGGGSDRCVCAWGPVASVKAKLCV